jgi:methionine-R-sulfoxide reductase
MKNLTRSILLPFLLCLFTLSACGQKIKQEDTETTSLNQQKNMNPYYSNTDTNKLRLSDAEWKKILPIEVYEISRQGETERPFSGKYWDSESKGTYYCAACGNLLFRSDAKFSSTCGWPSFFEQENKNSVLYKSDYSHGMTRIEALCGRCDGHLGHLFDDGPPPTGKRYCMNSIVLDFVPDKK